MIKKTRARKWEKERDSVLLIIKLAGSSETIAARGERGKLHLATCYHLPTYRPTDWLNLSHHPKRPPGFYDCHATPLTSPSLLYFLYFLNLFCFQPSDTVIGKQENEKISILGWSWFLICKRLENLTERQTQIRFGSLFMIKL